MPKQQQMWLKEQERLESILARGRGRLKIYAALETWQTKKIKRRDELKKIRRNICASLEMLEKLQEADLSCSDQTPSKATNPHAAESHGLYGSKACLAEQAKLHLSMLKELQGEDLPFSDEEDLSCSDEEDLSCSDQTPTEATNPHAAKSHRLIARKACLAEQAKLHLSGVLFGLTQHFETCRFVERKACLAEQARTGLCSRMAGKVACAEAQPFSMVEIFRLVLKLVEYIHQQESVVATLGASATLKVVGGNYVTTKTPCVATKRSRRRGRHKPKSTHDDFDFLELRGISIDPESDARNLLQIFFASSRSDRHVAWLLEQISRHKSFGVSNKSCENDPVLAVAGIIETFPSLANVQFRNNECMPLFPLSYLVAMSTSPGSSINGGVHASLRKVIESFHSTPSKASSPGARVAQLHSIISRLLVDGQMHEQCNFQFWHQIISDDVKSWGYDSILHFVLETFDGSLFNTIVTRLLCHHGSKEAILLSLADDARHVLISSFPVENPKCLSDLMETLEHNAKMNLGAIWINDIASGSMIDLLQELLLKFEARVQKIHFDAHEVPFKRIRGFQNLPPPRTFVDLYDDHTRQKYLHSKAKRLGNFLWQHLGMSREEVLEFWVHYSGQVLHLINNKQSKMLNITHQLFALIWSSERLREVLAMQLPRTATLQTRLLLGILGRVMKYELCMCKSQLSKFLASQNGRAAVIRFYCGNSESSGTLSLAASLGPQSSGTLSLAALLGHCLKSRLLVSRDQFNLLWQENYLRALMHDLPDQPVREQSISTAVDLPLEAMRQPGSLQDFGDYLMCSIEPHTLVLSADGDHVGFAIPPGIEDVDLNCWSSVSYHHDQTLGAHRRLL